MEQLKFMVDLNWRMYSEKLDKIFSDPKFLLEFNNFLPTETGKKWLKTTEGLKFVKWQDS